jgi:sugar phosphate isomerase/epimerase
MATVTVHACECWIQRIDACASIDDANGAIMASARVIDIAADFGADTIILGCGARLKLKGDIVATVLPSKKVDRARGGWRR